MNCLNQGPTAQCWTEISRELLIETYSLGLRSIAGEWEDVMVRSGCMQAGSCCPFRSVGSGIMTIAQESANPQILENDGAHACGYQVLESGVVTFLNRTNRIAV